MASQLDPYVILGLPRGASLAEIKRAYRKLAKAYHPDSAGPAATPRFLAIQAAYDALTEGDADARAPRPAEAGGRRSASGGDTSGPARPSDDPFGRRRRSAGPAPGAAPFGWRRRGSGDGPGGQPGSGGANGHDGKGSWWQRRASRAPNKAVMGSTTYDDAGEPEPLWEGAGWYGPATGTYWTINPREYADPRKHGPEYQARARRAAFEDDAAGFLAETEGSEEMGRSEDGDHTGVGERGREGDGTEGDRTEADRTEADRSGRSRR